MQQQQAFFFEIYRSGLRAAADMMKVSLENAERTTRQLSEAGSMTELMAVQARLANAQMEGLLDYWNRAWRTAHQAGEAYTSTQAANTAISHERKERKSA
jgi:hypothetical protein